MAFFFNSLAILNRGNSTKIKGSKRVKVMIPHFVILDH